MANLECARGHLYDADVYSTCPYCNSGSKAISFMDGGVAEIGKTGPVGGFAGALGDSMVPVDDAPEAGVDQVNKTKPLVDEKKVEQIRKTEPLSVDTGSYQRSGHGGVEPVSGWLVCVEGADKGKAFQLYTRINTVGRGASNDVSLSKDYNITSGIQARIAYDPKENEFWLVPGERNKNSNYVNGVAKYGETKLEAYDLIEMGSTKLLFVPFCCDRFKWGDNLQR